MEGYNWRFLGGDLSIYYGAGVFELSIARADLILQGSGGGTTLCIWVGILISFYFIVHASQVFNSEEWISTDYVHFFDQNWTSKDLNN